MNHLVLEQTARTTVKRLPKRGVYDRQTIYDILDEAYLCHLGFVAHGAPVVLPTIHWRQDDHLYVHGSSASRMLRTIRDTGLEACVTVTLLDGLVLARSWFHHSMNYRSAVVFGKAVEVTDRDEKWNALEQLVEQVAPGRASTTRPPNDTELLATCVLKMAIEEASAKIRTGPPIDDDEDYALPVWAGVVPLTMTEGEPIAAPHPVPLPTKWGEGAEGG